MGHPQQPQGSLGAWVIAAASSGTCRGVVVGDLAREPPWPGVEGCAPAWRVAVVRPATESPAEISTMGGGAPGL